MLRYIFHHIGVTNKYFVEFGFDSATYEGLPTPVFSFFHLVVADDVLFFLVLFRFTICSHRRWWQQYLQSLQKLSLAWVTL